MPLSEYEQRVLEQLERDLGADPKLGRTMARQPRSRGRLVFAVFGVIAGLAVLLIGAVTQIVILGVAGFGIMALAALWAMLGPRQRTVPAATEGTAKAEGGKADAGSKKGRRKDDRPFMVRLEERFERRREQGDL